MYGEKKTASIQRALMNFVVEQRIVSSYDIHRFTLQHEDKRIEIDVPVLHFPLKCGQRVHISARKEKDEKEDEKEDDDEGDDIIEFNTTLFSPPHLYSASGLFVILNFPVELLFSNPQAHTNHSPDLETGTEAGVAFVLKRAES